VVAVEDGATVYALLEERHGNLAAQRVRAANPQHAVFRGLVPGGAALAITAKSASTLLRSGPSGVAVGKVRKELPQDLVWDLRAVDALLADIEHRMSTSLDDYGSRLRSVDGVGSITAVRLIGRTAAASRFRSADAFATFAGVAPINIASGERTRHRLSGGGDRQLNSAIHLMAVTQVRCARAPGAATSVCARASGAATTTRRSPRATPVTRQCAA